MGVRVRASRLHKSPQRPSQIVHVRMHSPDGQRTGRTRAHLQQTECNRALASALCRCRVNLAYAADRLCERADFNLLPVVVKSHVQEQLRRRWIASLPAT